MGKKEFSEIELFGEKIERYAFFRIIFFGIALLTLIISSLVSPQIESLDIDNMSDAEFFSNIKGALLFWMIILLILIFSLCIIGFIVLGMFGKYIVQLKNVSKATSSLFLRNIFVCELSRSGVWFIQLFFLGSVSQIPLFILNAISAGISVYVIIQFKKWVGYMIEDEFKPSEIAPLQLFLKIWQISIISFICLSFLQIFIDGFFLIILACGVLLLISVVLWFFGKKIIWLFS